MDLVEGKGIEVGLNLKRGGKEFSNLGFDLPFDIQIDLIIHSRCSFHLIIFLILCHLGV